MANEFIETSIKYIQDAADRNKLVVFVGAGISMNSGLPSWPSLVREMGREIGQKLEDNSVESLIKIPQLYFNERKDKEYWDKVESLFNKKAKPNPIHRLLLELNPAHIVTTNYDDLIEQAAAELGAYYFTVRRNEDLPYAPLNKFIVKMHGDFSAKNIVLKEDDYLNYQANFKLIDVFVKSLFSSHLVLFVGFSATDTNFKIIFNWVKDVLGKDFQPAYLVEPRLDFDQTSFQYYKNKGINLLYCKEAQDEVLSYIEGCRSEDLFDRGNLKNEIGKTVYDFLSYIINKPSGVDGVIDEIYEKLEPLRFFSSVLEDDVRNAIGPFNFLDWKPDGFLHITDLTLIEKLKSEISLYRRDVAYRKSKRDKYKYITEVMSKAGLRGIKTSENMFMTPVVVWENHDELDVSSLWSNYYQYRFQELKDSLDQAKELGEIYSPNDPFALPFFHYKMGNYNTAYQGLRQVSRVAIQDNNQFVYYLSEFNKKSLANLISDEYTGVPIVDDEIARMRYEITSLDPETLFYNLPSYQRKRLATLRGLLTLSSINSLKNRLKKLLDGISRDKRTIESNGYSYNHNVAEVYRITSTVWKYIVSNHLMIEHHVEVSELFKTAVTAVITNHTIRVPYNAEFPSHVNRVLPTIAYWWVFLAIENFDQKSLTELLKGKTLNLDLDASKACLSAMANLLESFEGDHSDRIQSRLASFLEILCSSNLEESLIPNYLELLIETFKFNLHYDVHLGVVRLVMKLLSISSARAIDLDILHRLLTGMLRKSDLCRDPVDYIGNIKQAGNIIPVIVGMLGQRNEGYTLNEGGLVYGLVSNVNYLISVSHHELAAEYIRFFIAPIYPHAAPQLKVALRRVAINFIKKSGRNADNEHYLPALHSLLISGLCSFDNIIGQERVSSIYERELDKLIERYSAVHVKPDPIMPAMYRLGELLETKVINQKQHLIEKYRGLSIQFDLRFSPATVELSNIDFRDLAELTRVELISLFKKVSFRKMEQLFGKAARNEQGGNSLVKVLQSYNMFLRANLN